MKESQSHIETICKLVRECGQFIKNADRSHLRIDSKGGRANFVTEYDKKVQERLRTGLLEIMPDAHFIGEEGSVQKFSQSGKFFIVDPIDGTTNFIKDYRASCVSAQSSHDCSSRQPLATLSPRSSPAMLASVCR